MQLFWRYKCLAFLFACEEDRDQFYEPLSAVQWWTLSRVEAKAQKNEESYWKDLETNVSQLRTLLSPNNTREIQAEIKIHAEVQPMISKVEAAFWKIARRVEWMKCVRSA